MNIVVVTAGQRWEILKQSITSMMNNAENWKEHELVLSMDCWMPSMGRLDWIDRHCARLIINRRLGASAVRNIGASSIPKYRRQGYVCFFDDDVYCCRGWDKRLEEVLNGSPCAASAHAHPYNHTIIGSCSGGLFTTVLSTVNIACSWGMWDDVGFFAEPGGPGGSEDVDWCRRATGKGYGLVVTSPQCIVHTGITSSRGQPIVGADLVMARNKELEQLYGVEGSVRYV